MRRSASILDSLDASGQAENTWIFFTADHGLAVGHHGLFGKQNMHDHSVRVPFLVAGPGVAKGAKNDASIYLQDVMATALDLAGAEKPAHIFFNSLRPLLNGEQSSRATNRSMAPTSNSNVPSRMMVGSSSPIRRPESSASTTSPTIRRR
jgi:arylsulfatase A-like enzyme